MPLRLIFMGTPDFAVPVLDAVHAAGHTIVAVYSQPPRPAGRGMDETPSPVHRRAQQLGLNVRTPLNFKNDDDREALAALKSDVAVVVAYGLLLPQAVLDAAPLGFYNVHASQLPRWRGAAPIQRAIMAGDIETAVTIMRMEKGLDTGPMCLIKTVPITEQTTASALHDELSNIGASAMVEALALLEQRKLDQTSQPSDGVTYAAKIDKAEARIDFNRPARDVVRHIHGLSPFPGAWIEIAMGGKPERIKILEARITEGAPSKPPGTVLDDALTIQCATGAVQFARLQRAGKKPTSADEFLRGFRIAPGAYIASN
jgi:methionyl-tRNA formyltransferase